MRPRGAAGGDDGFEYFRVAGAAAQVSGETFADVGFRGMRVALEKIYGGESHAGSAYAALRSAVREERLLHGMQSLSAGDSLNRANRCPVGLQRGNQAAVHQRTVKFNRASAALAFAAAFFCAGEASLLAQDIEQTRHGIRFERHGAAVDLALHANFPTLV